jgi:hypothetical protein
MKYIALALLGLTGCASTQTQVSVARDISSLHVTLPPDTNAAYYCGLPNNGTTHLIASNNLPSIPQPPRGDWRSGSSQLVKVMREVGTEKLHLAVISQDGSEPLVYRQGIDDDAYRGANGMYVADTSWPLGIWQSESYQLTIHPDVERTHDGFHQIVPNVELRSKFGVSMPCELNVPY